MQAELTDAAGNAIAGATITDVTDSSGFVSGKQIVAPSDAGTGYFIHVFGASGAGISYTTLPFSKEDPPASRFGPAAGDRSPPEPYPADGYGNNYPIPERQFKRRPAVVFSNERTWVFRFTDHAERGYLSLFLRCANVPRLVWKKFFPRVAE